MLALSRRRPEPEKAYRAWHRDRAADDFGLGAVQLVQVERDVWVANMIGRRGIRKGSKGVPVRCEVIDAALSRRAVEAGELGASVHMPRMGGAASRASGRVSNPWSPSGWCGGVSR